jgi:hypothetical protein
MAGVATRVIARTFENETVPSRIASEIDGRSRSECATRMRSRAAPMSSPIRYESHAAQLVAPAITQWPRSSSIRINTSCR